MVVRFINPDRTKGISNIKATYIERNKYMKCTKHNIRAATLSDSFFLKTHI